MSEEEKSKANKILEYLDRLDSSKESQITLLQEALREMQRKLKPESFSARKVNLK